MSKDRFSIRQSKRGYCIAMSIVGSSMEEIIGSVETSDCAEMIVSALNGGDVAALKRWRRSPAGKQSGGRMREVISARLAA
jgi:hypothetical protein